MNASSASCLLLPGRLRTGAGGTLVIVARPFLQRPYDLFAGDHRLALRPGDRVRERLFQRALLGLEAMELVYLQHTEGLGKPLEGVPHLP